MYLFCVFIYEWALYLPQISQVEIYFSGAIQTKLFPLIMQFTLYEYPAKTFWNLLLKITNENFLKVFLNWEILHFCFASQRKIKWEKNSVFAFSKLKEKYLVLRTFLILWFVIWVWREEKEIFEIINFCFQDFYVLFELLLMSVFVYFSFMHLVNACSGETHSNIA